MFLVTPLIQWTNVTGYNCITLWNTMCGEYEISSWNYQTFLHLNRITKKLVISTPGIDIYGSRIWYYQTKNEILNYITYALIVLQYYCYQTYNFSTLSLTPQEYENLFLKWLINMQDLDQSNIYSLKFMYDTWYFLLTKTWNSKLCILINSIWLNSWNITNVS